MPLSVGSLRERLVIQSNAPIAQSVTSLTRSGAVATATFALPHGYAARDYVTVSGATPAGYNGKVQIATPSTTTVTYPVDGTLTTPATGTIQAIYVSDAQGGQAITWAVVASLWAEMIPLRAMERLQIEAVQSTVEYRFRVRARTDLREGMRALWTASWPRGAVQKVLQIVGLLPDEDGRTYMFIECAELNQ